MHSRSASVIVALIALSLSAVACRAATPTRAPTLPPTAVPTPSPTRGPTSTPLPPSLNFVEPATGATLISPAIVRGDGTIPPGERTVTVQVLDGQGTVLGEGVIRFAELGAAGEIGAFYGLVRYNAPDKAQPGRLAIVSRGKDAPVLASDQVSVTLRGAKDTPLAGVKIVEPQPAGVITSPLTIRGEGIVPAERRLNARVVDSLGNLLGAGTLQFASQATVGKTAPFSGTLEFSPPSFAQAGYVLVEQPGPEKGQILARDAVEVQLPAPQ